MATMAPIHVISLARATARQAQVAQEFARIGLNYTLFEGIDGVAQEADLLRRTDLAAWHRNMGAPISAGHMGCYASHVELWRKIATEDAEIVLICEDDVTFTADFPQALAAGLAMADRWDILRFSCIRAKGGCRRRALAPSR